MPVAWHACDNPPMRQRTTLRRASSRRYNHAVRLGSVAVIIVAACALGIGAGCSREAKPAVRPEEPPPLPPSAGTPIGHLVDNAAELKLGDEQLAKIKVINDDLAAQLAGDDAGLHPERVAPPADDKPRGLGFRASGMSGHGERVGGSRPEEVSGGAGAFPFAQPSSADDGGSSRQVVVPADRVNEVYQRRARHVRDAIRRALDVLDAGQQAIARKLLIDHGVNLDTGEVGADPLAPMQEPTPSQPLPREP
jgi:hypothetical protein